MKIFERIKRKYTNGDPSSEEKREYRRKEYHMVTHFTRCCGMGGNMQLISYWEHMGICMFMHIFTNTEKKELFERTQRKISVQCRRNKHARCCAIRYSPGS